MVKKISILALIPLLWVGCASKKCGPDDYDGFFNAILCDYDSMYEDKKQELDTKILERNRLFHEYQSLIALVTGKTEELKALEEQVLEIESDLSSINALLSKTNSDRVDSNTIAELKKSLKKMNRDILNKSTFFSVADASYTNVKLLEDSDKQRFAQAYGKDKGDKLKYAKAYNRKNLNGVAFAEAYTEDIENSKKIKTALGKKINKLSDSITNENLSDKKALLAELMSDVESYKNSIKGS